LVDPAQETVNQVIPFYPHGFVAGEVQACRFYASGPAANFREASQSLGIAVAGVRQIQLPFKVGPDGA
jgi:hypothetical protein